MSDDDPNGTPAPVSLSSLGIGGKGRVAALTLPPEERSRLFEMGVTIGAMLEIVRFAPLGDPIDIRVRGYHLSLRKREAAEIRVHPQ